MLKLNNVEVIYNDIILVLKGLSLEVPEGQIVALLGANGAGKSTTLKAISGLLKTEEGEVTDGTIEFLGERIDRLEGGLPGDGGAPSLRGPDHGGEPPGGRLHAARRRGRPPRL